MKKDYRMSKFELELKELILDYYGEDRDPLQIYKELCGMLEWYTTFLMKEGW